MATLLWPPKNAPDFSWQHNPETHKPPDITVDWCVRLNEDREFDTIPVGYRNPGARKNEDRVKAILRGLCNLQRRYLETGDSADLIVLSSVDAVSHIVGSDLWSPKWGALDTRRFDDLHRGKYFYAPNGDVHAVAHLLQAELFSVARSHAVATLGRLWHEEISTGVFMTDREVAAELARRLGQTDSVIKTWVAKLREMRKRQYVHFPKKTERGHSAAEMCTETVDG
ncbi:MAG: hypothetical protein HN742_35385 [Lentisphaerae bacterium]|jgi:hypothetical protein|nr:hypothetical protein [Lentisphaerota bacterium]MBT4818812.1 hypothetical protein [Lentisphaerota bacterium]MBT5604646.1 hypothetical protein [Lentisphaerota bacterium]MBT7057434.1 hypothetical protein [Lentisphaerota bacterium]MBT7847207.1 hypothetical protein [Lentisphaerota bacterium]